MPRQSVKRSIKRKPAPRSTVKGRCPEGKILRKGYTAVRKSTGRKYTVKAKCILERGRPGPGRGGSVKRRVIKISHPGSLSKYGYALSKTASERDVALNKILKAYGYSTTIKKLNAIAVLFRNTQPAYTRKLERDMGYIRKLDKRV